MEFWKQSANENILENHSPINILHSAVQEIVHWPSNYCHCEGWLAPCCQPLKCNLIAKCSEARSSASWFSILLAGCAAAASSFGAIVAASFQNELCGGRSVGGRDFPLLIFSLPGTPLGCCCCPSSSSPSVDGYLMGFLVSD